MKGEELQHAGELRALACPAVDRDRGPGRLCRPAAWRCRSAMPPACGGACCWPVRRFRFGVAIWAMHFVGMLAARLPFPVDYLVFPTLAVLPGLRDRGRRGGLCDQCRAVHAGAPDFVGLPDGRRHLLHALHRHERARMRAPIMMHDRVLRGGQHGDRHRRVRPGALARERARQASAADPVGDRLRLCRVGHALHGHGRHDALSRCRTTASGAPALSTDLLAIVVAVVAFCVSGTVPSVPGAGSRESTRTSTASATAAERRKPRPSRASRGTRRRRRCRERQRRTRARHLCAARRRRRTAAARSRAICRSSATAPRTSSRSRRSSPSTPTRTTPMSSTAAPSCSARSPSARSSRGSTRAGFVRVHRSHIVNIERVIGLPALRRQRDWSRWRRSRALRGPGQPQPRRLAEVAHRVKAGAARRRRAASRNISRRNIALAPAPSRSD